jgi:hypothetical protein
VRSLGAGHRGEVHGRHAWTVDMTFFNPNRRILEGELQFPYWTASALPALPWM